MHGCNRLCTRLLEYTSAHSLSLQKDRFMKLYASTHLVLVTLLMCLLAGTANAVPPLQGSSPRLQPLIRFEADRMDLATVGKALRADRARMSSDYLATYHAKPDGTGLPPVTVDSTVQTTDLTLIGYAGGAATFLLSPTTGLPTGPAPSNIDVVWSHDESFMIFASNRTSATNPAPSPQGNYHLYMMSPSGSASSIVQLTSGSGNERWPSLTGAADTGIAYAASLAANGGPYTLTIGQLSTDPATNLAEIVNPTPEASGYDVEHPSYSGNLVAFAGRQAKTTGAYSIYVLSLGEISSLEQLTSGGSDDENPAFAPTGSVLAWDTNAVGYVQSGNPVLTSIGTKATRDIYASQVSGVGITQFTNISGSNNIEPCWSSTTSNPFLNPNGTHVYMFFSSDRRYGKYNIYYLRATPSSGSSLLLDTEGTNNELNAQGVQIGANVAVEVNASDPSHVYNKYQPTVSLLNSFVSVGYVTNRYLVNNIGDNPIPGDPNDVEPVNTATGATFAPVSTSLSPSGHFEIFVSQLFDIDPPALLQYDNVQNELIRVEDAQGNDARYVPSGQNVTFIVRLSDRQSGVGQAYLQIKDPNSKYQDAAHLEHKIYTHPYDDGGVMRPPVFDEATSLSGYNEFNYGFDYFNGTAVDNNNGDHSDVGRNVLKLAWTAVSTTPTAITPGVGAGGVNPGVVIPVTSAAAFVPNNYVIIGADGTADQEIEFITAVQNINGAQSITVTQVGWPHAAGTQLMEPINLNGNNWFVETSTPSGAGRVSTVNTFGGLRPGDQIYYAGVQPDATGIPSGNPNLWTESNAKNYVQAYYNDGTNNYVNTLNNNPYNGNYSTYVVRRVGNFDPQGYEVDCQAIDAGQESPDASIPGNFYTPSYTPGFEDAGIMTGYSYPPQGPASEDPDLQVQSAVDFAANNSALVGTGFTQNDVQIEAAGAGMLTVAGLFRSPSPVGTPVQLGSQLSVAAGPGNQSIFVEDVQDYAVGQSVLIDTGIDTEEQDITGIAGAAGLSIAPQSLNFSHLVTSQVVLGSLSKAAVVAGANSITVTNAADFADGDTVLVDTGSSTEQLVIQSIAKNVLTFTTGFTLGHTAKVGVVLGTLVNAVADRSIWLQLSALPAAQQDGRGGVLYSATWQTPIVPSDYYLDVVTYDNAKWPVPYNLQNEIQDLEPSANSLPSSNWRIYDQVWGFTTNTFTGQHGILVVNDYSLPQKFFNGKFGEQGVSNAEAANYFGSESYITDVDDSYLDPEYGGQMPPASLPNAVLAYGFHQYATDYPDETPIYGDVGLELDPVAPSIYNDYAVWPEYGYGNTLGVNSYSDGDMSGGQTVDGAYDADSQQYDIWRILCRGPIPASVLLQYAPTLQTQPADPLTNTPVRQVTVASSCVIWQSPFTGDEFAANGTLEDPTTQANLISFIQQGGRLYVEGKDVGYALTGNTPNGANTFLTTYLDAQFDADEFGYLGAVANKGGTGRISGDAYNDTNHAYWIPQVNGGYVYDSLNQADEMFYLGNGGANEASRADIGDRDAITPGANAQVELQFVGNNGNAALIDTTIPSTINANLNAVVVYSSFGGPESIGQDIHRYGIGAGRYYAHNVRTKLMHNIICWLRTGSIFGSVYTSGTAGQPVAGAVVIATNGVGGQYTGATDSTGHFHIEGLVPDAYTLSGYKAGYSFQHAGAASWTHGGDFTTQNLLVNQVAPGVVVVTVLNGAVTPNAGIAGVSVTLADATGLVGSPSYPGTTNAQGQVTFTGVAAGMYNVTANGSAVGFSTATTLQPITVASGQTTSATLILTPLPAQVTGTVTVHDPGKADNGAAIVGAIVTATGTGTTQGTYTGTSAAGGVYTVAGIPAGTYTITCTAVGYLPGTSAAVTLKNGQTVTQNFALTPVATLVVNVVDGYTQAGIQGVTVSAKGQANLAPVITNANGQVGFTNVLLGTYTITANGTAVGYSTVSQTTTVSTRATVTVTITLLPLPATIKGTVTAFDPNEADNGFGIIGSTIVVTHGTTVVAETTPTASSGVYTLPPVAAGTYTVTAAAPGFVSQSTNVTVTAGQTLVQDFQLLPAGNLTVTVIDAATKLPLVSVPVTVQIGQYGYGPLYTGSNGVAGQVQFTNIHEGAATVTANGMSIAYSTVTTNATVGTASAITIALTALPGTITGFVQVGYPSSYVPVPSDNGAPIVGATVQASVGNKVVDTVTTAADGSYTFALPQGSYTISAAAAGFVSGSLSAPVVTTSGSSTVAPSLSLLHSGNLTVNVIDATSGQPIGLASVVITQLPNVNTFGPFTTSSNGSVLFPNIPLGSYSVAVDGVLAGYGKNTAAVIVATASSVTVKLKPLPGQITGQVTVADSGQPDNGNPIANATITAVGIAPTVGTFTATTNKLGVYTISNLVAGMYSVTAQAANYEPSSATSVQVLNGQATTANFALQATGTVYGLVYEVSAGKSHPIAGATLTFTDQNGYVYTALSQSTEIIGADGSPANYTISLVPGSYTLTVSAPGFQPPASQVIVVSAAVNVRNDELLAPLHSYPAGIQMISAPADYTGTSIEQIFGGATGIELATWVPGNTPAGYTFSPSYPSDTMHIGRGYWVNFSGPVNVTADGIPASTNQPFQIGLGSGWNMVGDPFPASVPISTLSVVDSVGNVYSFLQASSPTVNLLNGTIYKYDVNTGSYVSESVAGAGADTIDPYVGYWFQAYTACTILVPVQSVTAAGHAKK